MNQKQKQQKAKKQPKNKLSIVPPVDGSRECVSRWLIEHSHLTSTTLAKRSGLSEDIINKWRIDYDVINPYDKELLLQWLDAKSYTLSEAAILLGMSYRRFKALLKRHNITKYDKKLHHDKGVFKPPKRRLHKLKLEVLKDPKALDILYQYHSAAELAQMIGIHTLHLFKFIHQYGIKLRKYGLRPTHNPCKSRKWLEEHYIEKRLSIIKCAELAGVCFKTIHNWLIEFGIRPRLAGGRNPTIALDKDEIISVKHATQNQRLSTVSERHNI